MASLLGDRYASIEMRNIWSRENKIIKERELWIDVLQIQKRLGFQIDDKIITDYKNNIAKVNLESIDSREARNQHDVMARIEEFNSLAGQQAIHVGMTSRDLTENIEIKQVHDSLKLVLFKCDALLFRFGKFIDAHKELAMVGRTHNVPAQVTTLGRRFAMWAEELFFARQHLVQFLDRLPMRGIKGAIGTGQDMRQLLGDGATQIDGFLQDLFGLNEVLITPSQVYPRSIDFEMVSLLSQIAAAPSNLATNIRLLAGLGLANEGFAKDQVGSSAMPHKVNPRLSERINSLHAVLKGHVTMIHELVGAQWNEGDVSCSVVRRVALPDSFYAIDAILDTSIRIIQNISIEEKKIAAELERELPFLLSSSLLILAVKNGAKREEAHATIKRLARQAYENEKNTKEGFLELISREKSLNLKHSEIEALASSQALATGPAHQAKLLCEAITTVLNNTEKLTQYSPAHSI
jgi:adenylosuccinate lyase